MAMLIARLLTSAVVVFRAILDVMRIFGIKTARTRAASLSTGDFYDPFN